MEARTPLQKFEPHAGRDRPTLVPGPASSLTLEDAAVASLLLFGMPVRCHAHSNQGLTATCSTPNGYHVSGGANNKFEPEKRKRDVSFDEDDVDDDEADGDDGAMDADGRWRSSVDDRRQRSRERNR